VTCDVCFLSQTLTFLALTAFLAGVFLLVGAGFVLADLLSVITFFGAPRLDGAVVFLVVVDFTLPAKTFLGAPTVFLAGGGTAVVARLEFSFEPDVKGVALGASLTLPDGPLGSTKIPPSVPLAMARLS